jgi:hypothetical protein
MALDENDDPLFAYLAVPASVEGNVAPGDCDPDETTVGCDGIYFTRWNPCTGAFTSPVIVDPNVNYYGTNEGAQRISLAYDTSTREVGIAYTKRRRAMRPAAPTGKAPA